MPAPKKPARLIDAVHPGDTPPPTSSRPVVVTNRPILTTDPMLSVEGIDNTGSEKPSGEAPVTPSGVPKITRSAKDIEPMANKQLETPQPSETAHESGMQESITNTGKQTPTLNSEKPEATGKQMGPAREKMKIEPLHEVRPSSDEDESEVKIEEQEPESTDKEEDPKSAQEMAIERHIEAGTYFVPIGQVKRRRRMLVTLIILTLLAVVVVVDLLLDMGLLTLNLPHTNFLQ